MAASGILAGLKLESEVIYQLLRRDITQESTVYRSILAEREERKQREIAINLLRRGVAIDIIAPSTGLSVEEVQKLQPGVKLMLNLTLQSRGRQSRQNCGDRD